MSVSSFININKSSKEPDMKFDELLVEAPLGLGNTLKTAVKAMNPFSLGGRSQAQGQLGTGRNANQIYSDYYKWLGSTGQQPDTDNVISFLKQNRYSQQAIAAAQTKFPPAPEAEPAPPGDTRVEPTLGDPPAPAEDPAAAEKARQNNLKQRLKTGQGMGTKTGSGFKDSEVGAQRNKLITKPDGSTQMVPIREGAPLSKDQLSAVFTAVAQTGATSPKQSTNTARPSGAGYQNNVGQSGGYSGGYGGSSAQSGGGRQAPAIDNNSIVSYYKSLKTDDDRKALRALLDQADAELVKPPPSVDPVAETIGYSRFLGMKL